MSDKHEYNNSDSAHKTRSLFGRRQGRPLKSLRASVMENIYPKIKISPEILQEDRSYSPEEFFKNRYSSYWLEIGFGYGEHIATLAKDNPDTGYLGAEPFINGMAAFVKDISKDIENNQLQNIRVLMDDGMIIAKSLKHSSLDGIYVLNPDPWHKKRHHKRRLINKKNLDIFAKILKPGAKLVMTSDVEDLSQWMCSHATNHPDFRWTANNKQDWDIPPKDWIKTRYEEKGAKGAKRMVYLFFERK